MAQKIALIIGAGPAGLTAAYELLQRTGVTPLIVEKSAQIGGLAKTLNFNGNRMDVGGHRFFSKSDRVMDWWKNILPIETAGPRRDDVMLVRNRRSRIYHRRRFFDYPLSLSVQTLQKLGFLRTLRILASYLWVQIAPVRPEKSLEDFLINRFGRELYATFFKSYTEKVWGVPCREIKAEWGRQRIKGLSLGKAVRAWLRKRVTQDRSLAQKSTETSLIERFLYPKFGPGQMWETVARGVQAKGAELLMNTRPVALRIEDRRVTGVTLFDEKSGRSRDIATDYVFSTMPVSELIALFGDRAPQAVRRTAQGLLYRNFITVGLLLKRVHFKHDGTANGNGARPLPTDNWIYVQEHDVRMGRLQIYNNWSPYLVENPDTAWIGAEFFCDAGDDLWEKSDDELKELAAAELVKLEMIDRADLLEMHVVKTEKAYPAYFGTYEDFGKIREFTDGFENLFLIGRNGMHRYNNQDHSMLAAMVAVDHIVDGTAPRGALWSVNTEQAYLEQR